MGREPAAGDSLVRGQGHTARRQEDRGQQPAAGGTVCLVGVPPGREGWGRPDIGAVVVVPWPLAAVHQALGPHTPGSQPAAVHNMHECVGR